MTIFHRYKQVCFYQGSQIESITYRLHLFIIKHSEGDFGLFWRDIKVIDHYAYIGSEDLDHGMQVFDLHQLRGLTAENSRVCANSF